MAAHNMVPGKALLACIVHGDFASGDWDQLILAANRTLTTATLAERVLQGWGGERVPDDVRNFLTEVRARVGQRNKLMLAQAVAAVQSLNRLGVQPVLIKGVGDLFTRDVAVAQSRILSDIDLVVPVSRVRECVDVLKAAGYVPVKEHQNRLIATVLERPVDVGAIDLHCYLRPDLGFTYERLRQGATSVSTGGARAWIPSPTMRAAALILHDQLHDGDFWRGLIDVRHVLDLYWLLDSPVDWDALAACFRDRTSRAALHTQLLTASKLLGVDVPAKFRSGWAARLQYRRRIWQAKWPRLLIPFTILSLLMHPPPRRPVRGSPGGAGTTSWFLTRVLAKTRRLCRHPAIGKI